MWSRRRITDINQVVPLTGRRRPEPWVDRVIATAFVTAPLWLVASLVLGPIGFLAFFLADLAGMFALSWALGWSLLTRVITPSGRWINLVTAAPAAALAFAWVDWHVNAPSITKLAVPAILLLVAVALRPKGRPLLALALVGILGHVPLTNSIY